MLQFFVKNGGRKKDMPMTEQDAKDLAAKREKHKPKSMSHKRWAAVHDSVKGWHVALVDHVSREAERLKYEESRNLARIAVVTGNMDLLMSAAHDALMAKVRAELADVNP